MIHRLAEKTVAIFLFFILAIVYCGIVALADAPVLNDLKLDQRLDDPITSFGEFWKVHLTLDLSHQPIAAVSNLKLRAYDYKEYEDYGSQGAQLVAESIDHPVQANSGNFVDDYPVSIEIPKSASGHLVIEACAKHGNNGGCISWEGWIPQEPSYEFSGGLEFLYGIQPPTAGIFVSTQWILSIDACGIVTVTLDTLNCCLLCEDPAAEVPTWWRVWDSNSDNDGELDLGELADSGWIAAADFVAHWNESLIVAPPGWSGEMRFQVKMKRSGIADPAGTCSATLKVDVYDGAQ